MKALYLLLTDVMEHTAPALALLAVICAVQAGDPATAAQALGH